MPKQILWNDNWAFTKEGVRQDVTLPHTWNALDGQDGGNDYWRGTCVYEKRFAAPTLAPGEQLWIEFRGAAMTAEVSLNGHFLCRHEGGFSTFRAELTPALEQDNVLTVTVDNGKNRRVYPQNADFTFYGGLYRDVYLLTVPETHFALEPYGAPALRVTPKVSGSHADVLLEARVSGNADQVLFEAAGQTLAAPVEDGLARASLRIENAHLWDGVMDPYLYTASARLPGDEISVRFGCRTFAVDPDKGFLLNGRPYRLCGAARHQDREGLGNALTLREHREDMALIREMGANTLRLAHYQHAQEFYDLCDENGLIVWAEIPYISEHMPEGRDNTVSQMTELICQNYNHPCIICWGLSNEITAVGGVSADLMENHRILNDLCHKLDPTRLTTMANLAVLDPADPLVALPDLRGYNLYYGWYTGEWDQNDDWIDLFHKNHPDLPVSFSEYGADANPAYQSARPEKGDWTEGYQAAYHEHMLKMWWERPYIWAMHCWNMFDFGADNRSDGGKPGQNQKGLVTFDRTTKKDAFYIYKAYLSKEPFVHVCGRRYVDRAEAETEIKVYSNQSAVSLLVDGKPFAKQAGDKVFRFRVPLTGEHRITAVSGDLTDTITVRKADAPNPDYRKPGSAIVNWFDDDSQIVRPGCFSIKDTMADVKADPEAARVLEEYMAPLQAKVVELFGDAARNVSLPPEMQAMMDRMSVESSLKQVGGLATAEFVRGLNAALNRVKKEGC